MLRSRLARLGLAAAAVLVLGPARPGTGREEPLALEEPAPSEAVAPLVQRGLDLSERIERRISNLDAFQERMLDARGEDAAVLRELVANKEVAILHAVNALAENVLAQEQAGYDVTEIRAYTEMRIHRITPAIVKRIKKFSASVRELRASREAANPEDLLALEKRITLDEERLQFFYASAWNHVQLLERMEIQVGDEREFLIRVLDDRAETIGGRVRVARRQRDALTEHLAKRPDDAGGKARLDSMEERIRRDTRDLSQTVKLLDELGIPTAVHRQLLIETTGEITADVLDREVAIGLIRDLGVRARKWFLGSAPAAIFKLIFFLLIVLTFWLISRVWRAIAERALGSDRVQASQLLRGTLVSWVARSIVLIGILVGLSQMGVQLGPLLAGLGIAGFILGFALQDSLANFAAGALILIYRPFDVGDVLEAVGVSGTVKEMSLVNTTILTFDNQTLVVPNNKIWGDVIRNVTTQDRRRVDMKVRIGYSEDVDRVLAVLFDVAKAHPKVLAEPEPLVRLHELGEWCMLFVVRPWTLRQDYWEVYWDVTRAVKKRLDEEGIAIAVPRGELHISGPEA